ncbi:MAG: YunC family protein [Bacteroidetes bacterium]|nr:YunC family protein [Bacteroidota bacterium]
MNDIITIEGRAYQAYHIPTQNTSILLLFGKNGFLACGYINIEIANKRDDACAIITGIKTVDELLTSEVKMVSSAARKIGVMEGMTGKEALMLMS